MPHTRIQEVHTLTRVVREPITQQVPDMRGHAFSDHVY
jgi:hypothetical protein